MHKLLTLTLLTALLGSCAPTETSLTQPPFGQTQPAPATATQTAVPSRTPIPTQTIIPTTTPYPPLQTDGPHLLFTNDNKNFTIMDADGSGRIQFQLPNDGFIIGRPLKRVVSPDGQWLAYYTGSDEEPYDLALNLLNLFDGNSQTISNLIAPGFPENLEPVTETAFFTEYDNDCANDPKCKLGIVSSAFREGMRYSIDWSPDSQLLAFAAQIDGSSSDVYVFNISDGSIKRLTNESENIWSIDWSPRGNKILYLDSSPGTIYTSLYFRVVDPAIQRPQSPKRLDGGLFWGSNGWLDNGAYFLWDGGEGAPPHNFRYLDLETQQTKLIWKYDSDGFSFLGDLGGFVVIVYPDQPDAVADAIQSGTYFVTFSGKSTMLSEEIFFPYDRQSLKDFFFYSDNGMLYAMSPDGIISPPITKVTNETSISISPNKEWFIVSKNYRTIELYTENLELISTWETQAYEIIWRFDSQGFFLRGNPNLYYVPILDENFDLVDVCPADCVVRDYVWLP